MDLESIEVFEITLQRLYMDLIKEWRQLLGEKGNQQDKPSIIQALETVNDGISVLNDEGKFEYMNQEYADLFKYNKEELIGKTMAEVGIINNSNLFTEEILPALKEKGRWRGIITCTRKDGTKFLAENSISMIQEELIVSTITDNTVHEVYKTLLKNFPEGGVTVYDRKLDYIMANETTPEWDKVTPTEAEGKNISEIYSDENLKTMKKHYETALNGEPNTFRIKCGNKWYLFRVIPLEDREGNIFAGMAISQDITTLKKREENLGEFNKMVGHDLKNPLNTALGYLALQQEEYSTKEIEKSIQALKNMIQIVDDIAVTTKDPEELQMKEINLKDAFVDALDVVEPKPESYKVEDIIVEADNGQMIRMFVNLIGNSIEHNDKPVNIKVGKIENGFYYEDDGKGISKHIKEKIFQKGMTTSETEYGIGMYLVRRIAEIHNWSIEVTDSNSGGARFEFYINRLNTT